MSLRLWSLGGFLVLACGLASLAGQPISQAAEYPELQQVQPIDPIGEPKGFKAGDTVRYAVWVGPKGSWHVRTTTAKKLHHFKGKIWVDAGVFTGVEPHDLEFKGKFGDWWKLSEKRHEIVIDFKTDRAIDGINFQVSPEAKFIRFNLHVDGKHHKNLIFVGRGNQHPDLDPFVLAAHYAP
jgi:hypothetical protein